VSGDSARRGAARLSEREPDQLVPRQADQLVPRQECLWAGQTLPGRKESGAGERTVYSEPGASAAFWLMTTPP
jgi:hypothetical protein